MLQSNAGTPGLNAEGGRGINCRYTKGALGVQEKRKWAQQRIYVECVEEKNSGSGSDLSSRTGDGSWNTRTMTITP